MRKHYLNLSNGIEAWPEVFDSGELFDFVRFRSTTLEKKDWWTLFEQELSDDLLMRLAIGFECVLHDRGTLRPNSKTCYFGVPLIRYVLHRVWFGTTPEINWIGPHKGPAPSQEALFERIFEATVGHPSPRGGALRRRLSYYKRFLLTSEIRFTFSSLSTERDGDTLYQSQLVQKMTT